jgi:hypothetical protein
MAAFLKAREGISNALASNPSPAGKNLVMRASRPQVGGFLSCLIGVDRVREKNGGAQANQKCYN